MPNFDGTGPLKRGRLIGLGPGPCKNCAEGRTQKAEDHKSPVGKDTEE